MTNATYDGLGQRTSSTIGSTTRSFVWNDTVAIPELLSGTSIAYIYGPNGTPFETVAISSGTIHYLVADSIESVRGVVNSSGPLSASTSYDAWGNAETLGGLDSYTSFGFAGAFTDGTGLLYLINRYYDSTTDQFLSIDPAVSITNQPYVFTNDDPLNAADPTGLLCLWGCITHGVSSGFDAIRHGTAHVADNGVTEVTSHYRGLTKIVIAGVTIVGTAACVAATAGVCGALAFSVSGFEISGGAIAAGVAAGGVKGAADYALDSGHHSLSGFFKSAAIGGGEDALFAGLPEEAIFGNLGQGAHSAEMTFSQSLTFLPSYLAGAFKMGAHGY